MLTLRKSDERGFADHGWLKSRHTFSFANYFDERHMGFGPLRVINEDWIAAGRGFDTHPHKDMEIVSYVVKGALEHKDSMGNRGVILPGEVQRMSAGTGVYHSEFNHLSQEETHLLQIWIHPSRKGISPGYEQRSFANELKDGSLVLVASQDGREGSLTINQDADIYVSRVPRAAVLEYQSSPGGKLWLQVVKGSVLVNALTVSEGDGVSAVDEPKLVIKAGDDSEFLLFDFKNHP